MTPSLEDFIVRSRRLAPTTKESYIKIIRSYVSMVGDTRTYAAAERYYVDLLGRVSPQTAKLRMGALRYVSSRWAAHTGRPEDDFARRVEISRDFGPVHEPRALDADEIRALVATTKRTDRPIDLRDRAAIYLLLLTGIRVGGLIGLQISDVTFSGTCTVTFINKGGNPYTMSVADAAARPLHDWVQVLARRKLKSGYLFIPMPHQIAATPTYSTVAPMTYAAIRKALTARAVLAGIEDFHLHMTRRTFVTRAAQLGVSDRDIASATGHTLPGGVMQNVYLDRAVIRNTNAGDAIAAWARI